MNAVVLEGDSSLTGSDAEPANQAKGVASVTQQQVRWPIIEACLVSDINLCR